MADWIEIETDKWTGSSVNIFPGNEMIIDGYQRLDHGASAPTDASFIRPMMKLMELEW